jgi:hypothetical protein
LQLEPSSVSDGAGGVILAWIDDRFDYWRVYIKRIDAAGHDVWNSVWVAEGVGPQRRPLLVSDGAYGAIVVCETHGVEPNTTELLAQRIDASGARRWGSNGVTVATDVVPGAAVTTSDEDRGVIVAWSAGAGLELNLYAQRLDSTGVAMWPAPGVAVCVAPSLQFQMAIAPDGASGAIVTWSDLRTSDYNIFAQRISAGGQAVWDPDGLALCNAGQAQLEPTIVADQSGGAIIAWMDYRSVDAAAIYAQRVSTDGITRWTPNGLLLSNGTDNQFYPVAVTDGVSGVIVTWLSAGSAPAVIAQHVYATGFLAWQPGGVVLGSTSGQSGRPAAVPDGGGGVIAAWMEAPTAVRNVVIERLRADGVPLWAQNVAAGAWEQQAPILAPAEHGNAIVAWEDWRVAPEELYLQKFGDAGALWEVNGGRTPTLVSLASATAAPDLAQVRWHLGDPAMDVTIERWTTESGWQTREAHARADGTGFVSIDDRDIVAGLRYGYRLSWIEDGIARFGGEVFVDVPAAFALALERAWPNPALHELHVALTLPSAAPAALELIDLSGRRVLERTVARAGRLTVTVLEGRSIEPGVYFLRLRQGGASVYRKISVIR